MDRILSTLDLEAAATAWDVVVIGAGPAGSIAARQIAAAGARTLLVDRSHFPRAKVCGCCINGAALEVLDRAGLQGICERSGAVPLTQFQLAHRGRRAAVPLNCGFSLSRERFDAGLVVEAILAGAAFLDATTATVGECSADRRPVILDRRGEASTDSLRRCRARFVVVADGLGGRALATSELAPTRTARRSRIGAGTVLAAFETETADCEIRAGTIHMCCHRDGYAGMVTLEDGRLDVAAALDVAAVKRHGGIAPLAAAIVTDAGFPLGCQLASAAWQGTVKLTRQRLAAHGDRLFVIGDAAGYVEPFTGEGIAWALATGVAVAPIVLAAVNDGAKTAGQQWSTIRNRMLKTRSRQCRLLSTLLRYPTLVSCTTRLLARMPALARPVVSSLNSSIPTS